MACGPDKCFRVGRVLLVAVGSLRNAARKLQVTIKDDRSVVRGGRDAENTLFLDAR